MEGNDSQVQVHADLNRLREQLHELHQRMQQFADESNEANHQTPSLDMVTRGR